MINFQESTSLDYNKSLKKYFSGINKIPLIRSEEEILLEKKIRKGDTDALSKLVLSNLQYVVSVAKEYRNSGLQFGDMINDSNLGLMKAAKGFNETKGFRFITYAVWWIRQSILQAITNYTRIIRLPAKQQNNLSKIAKTQKTLEQEFKRAQTLQEIASSLKISENKIHNIYQLYNKCVSFDSLVNSTNRNSFLDLTKDNNNKNPDVQLVKESFQYEMYTVLNSLTFREAEIVCMNYGIFIDKALTLEEIGKKYKLAHEKVRQIKENAIVRLRHIKKVDPFFNIFNNYFFILS